MSNTQSIRTCPECEQPLPPDAPEGLCPECLMLGGLETMPLPDNLKPTGRLPEKGETFGGYRIGRDLGRGGMGAVFEAEQIETGRRVALKLLNHQLDSPDARARFLREGRLAASINHPNSVYVYGTEEIGDMPAIAMELVGGGTLEKRVKESGALPFGEGVDTILQVIAGLEAAQEVGILHRDVKPGNCFQDIDGTVKVGDFGLSISTEARDEKHLTMDGAIFGTPAFASPEQLRGDELNVRSDIYAVGATLFYLLTGRPAFRGKSVAQLFANVLEGKAPSPKELRPELPGALAGVVMRCLEKAPSERFQSYAELRKVLQPFSPDAPVPAPIPLRFVAGALDWMIYMTVAMGAQFAFLGGPIIAEPMENRTLHIFMAGGFTCWILYFTLMEGRLGHSLGKALCRIRVVGLDGLPPGYLKSLLRAIGILLLPSLPMILFAIKNPFGYVTEGSGLINQLFAWSYFFLIALVFLSARRRNWFASVVDLATETRVIRRKRFYDRPGLPGESLDPVVMAGNEAQKVGPYHILEVLEKGENVQWFVGYDTRLLRKIWIRTVPAGTDPVSFELRQLGRVGRLRWLAGRRSDEENWDAYEFPGGQSLLSLVEQGRPAWSSVRYWLLDLAEELEAAEAEGTAPELLSLNRVWITGKGRTKLLDFPAEADADEEIESAGSLIEKVAAIAALPIPMHAIALREGLNSSSAPSAVVAAVKPIINRFTTVTRLRRVALIAGCLAFPFLAGMMMFVGAAMMESWNKRQPEILELNQVLSYRDMAGLPWMKGQNPPEDRLFAIYIANHFRNAITSDDQWNSMTTRSMIVGEKRWFAEQSLKDFPNPTEEEIQEAEAEIGPVAATMKDSSIMEPWFPLAAVGMGALIYVGLPAIVLAVICRGGLVMLFCGVAVARKGGTRASRGRCLWRSLITWSPWFMAMVAAAFLSPLIGAMETAVVVIVWVVLITACSLWLPDRSLQDRLAGTWLVPK